MSVEAAPADSAPASPPGDTAQVFLMDGTRDTGAARRILPYDFRNPTAISEADLRVFEQLYQSYVPDIAAKLSTALRMECSFKTTKLTSLPFADFGAMIPNPSCITLFRIEGARGIGILDANLMLALAIADRMLGGRGLPPAAERTLTEIEMALLDDALQLILTAWSDLWAEAGGRPHPDIVSHETSALCLPMASSKEVFVVLDLETSVGETKGQVRLGVPFTMVEPGVRKKQEEHNRLSEKARPRQMQWRNQYAGIAVPVLAQWQVREMPLAETLHFRTGDVIELPASLINNASIHLSNLATFTGTVGIQNGNVAIQITGRSGGE